MSTELIKSPTGGKATCIRKSTIVAACSLIVGKPTGRVRIWSDKTGKVYFKPTGHSAETKTGPVEFHETRESASSMYVSNYNPSKKYVKARKNDSLPQRHVFPAKKISYADVRRHKHFQQYFLKEVTLPMVFTQLISNMKIYTVNVRPGQQPSESLRRTRDRN
jgi:hypothetical protein